jgi:hypothetical protein
MLCIISQEEVFMKSAFSTVAGIGGFVAITLAAVLLLGCGQTMMNGTAGTVTGETEAKTATREDGDISPCRDLKPFVDINIRGWGRPVSIKCSKSKNSHQIEATFNPSKGDHRDIVIRDCKNTEGGAEADMQSFMAGRRGNFKPTRVGEFKAIGEFKDYIQVPVLSGSSSGTFTAFGMGNGFLQINVANRFVVHVSNMGSERIKSLEDLKRAAEQMNLKKLEAMASTMP